MSISKYVEIHITKEGVWSQIQRLAVIEDMTPEAWVAKYAEGALALRIGSGWYLSPNEVAVWLGVHRNTVFNMLRRREFPRVSYLTARTVRIPIGDLQDYLDRRRLYIDPSSDRPFKPRKGDKRGRPADIDNAAA